MSGPPLSEDQEIRLARYRAGALAHPEREAFERELLESDALAEALYAEQSLDRASRGAGVGVAAPRRRVNRAALAAAAAVLLAVFATLQPRLLDRAPAPMRSGASAIALSMSADGEWLEWTAVAGADAYRVLVMDETGQEAASEVVSALRVRVTDVAPEAVTRGEWRVVPLTADGIELPSSAPLTFRRAR